MERQLVRLTGGSSFTLGGERVDNGARLELQLEGDCWIGGTIGWSSALDDAIPQRCALPVTPPDIRHPSRR